MDCKDELQTVSSKFQMPLTASRHTSIFHGTTSNIQVPSSNSRRDSSGNWDWEFVWSLEFGALWK